MKVTDHFLRYPEVVARTGYSRASIKRLVSDGTFPRPYQIGTRAVAWLESEVAAWMQARPATGLRAVQGCDKTRHQQAGPPHPTTTLVPALNPATLEAAAQRLEMSNATVRLHAGELTASEMRAVQAVLAWKARELRTLACSESPAKPQDG